MKFLLPFDPELSRPKNMILDIDIPAHYDMFKAL